MFDMRIRIPELMAKRQWETGYQLSTGSNGRIPMTIAYRLVRSGGRMKRYDPTVLEALCDVFDVGPGDLLERDKPEKRKR